MIPLAADSLGAWGWVLLGIYILGALLYLAFFYGAGRAEREQHAERREVDGPMTSISDFAAERDARANRARFRHATRFNEKSDPRRSNDRVA